MTERETFMAVLSNGSLTRGDAIVLLSGDGEERLNVACGLFKQGLAPVVVVSGAVDNPPFSLTSARTKQQLMGMGIAPDRIIEYGKAQNTKEEAELAIELALLRDWKRLLVVTSPYHSYRAALTFLKALERAGKAQEICVIMVPSSMYISWFQIPDGESRERVQLLRDELHKVDVYREKGDVSEFHEYIEYRRYWDARVA